jgi:soluble lytic murein transglycosylase-like protein
MRGVARPQIGLDGREGAELSYPASHAGPPAGSEWAPRFALPETKMRRASGLRPPRPETPVLSGPRTALLVAGSVVLAGCASPNSSLEAEPPAVEVQARSWNSAVKTRAAKDTRLWGVLSGTGREAKRMGNYSEAEKRFLAALTLTASLPPDDVRTQTTLGNLVTLAALYHQQGRDEDAQRLMSIVAEQVDSRGLAPHIKIPYGDVYRSLIEPPRRLLYAEHHRSRLRKPRTPSPAPGSSSPPVEQSFDELIARTARSFRVDPALVKAVIATESNFEVTAVSRVGAQGLMQLMPETAQEMGVLAPFEPSENLRGGVRYLREMLDRYGDTRLALAAYNAGPEAVDRHDGIPPYPETEAYVRRVLDYYRGYQSHFAN